MQLTPTQLIALIALCEPMLTRNGDEARPRSTGELAERLGWKHDYARNVVKDVRERLTRSVCRAWYRGPVEAIYGSPSPVGP